MSNFKGSPNGQNAKFQCLSDAEFPKFSKNGLTFYHSPFLLGVIVKKQWAHFFWNYTVKLYSKYAINVIDGTRY